MDETIFTRRSVIVVNEHSLEKFIKGVLGRGVELVAAEEWSNDSQYLYSGINGEFKWRWDKDNLKAFLDGGPASPGIVRLLLNHLCAIGEIDPGDYLITVSW